MLKTLKSSNSARVYTKKYRTEPANFVVDQNDIFWNTFFDFVFDWYPILKEIYEENFLFFYKEKETVVKTSLQMMFSVQLAKHGDGLEMANG